MNIRSGQSYHIGIERIFTECTSIDAGREPDFSITSSEVCTSSISDLQASITHRYLGVQSTHKSRPSVWQRSSAMRDPSATSLLFPRLEFAALESRACFDAQMGRNAEVAARKAIDIITVLISSSKLQTSTRIN